MLKYKIKDFINLIQSSISMAKKEPKTFSGMINKAVTGDGRKKPASLLSGMFGDNKKKK